MPISTHAPIRCPYRAIRDIPLDLTKWYWQVLMEVANKEKTAFATLQGLFQYKVMLFGLHGAASTFQRLVDLGVRSVPGLHPVYTNDIIVFSLDWISHLHHLEAALQAWQQPALRLIPRNAR